MNFYVSVFPDSKIVGQHRPGGKLLVGEMVLAGQEVTVLNGGPNFSFNDGVSLYVDCADQAEVDDYWDKLTADGGSPIACGWLKDKFGLRWQIIPSALPRLMQGPNGDKVMAAMMQMVKIDIAALEEASRG